jgi:hypothetical protein
MPLLFIVKNFVCLAYSFEFDIGLVPPIFWDLVGMMLQGCLRTRQRFRLHFDLNINLMIRFFDLRLCRSLADPQNFCFALVVSSASETVPLTIEINFLAWWSIRSHNCENLDLDGFL